MSLPVETPKPKRGHPFTNTYRLWLKGHRIGGKTAWRIHAKEFTPKYVLKSRRGRRLRHHSKYRLGARWIGFGEDFVYVRQESGELKRYYRKWWLPFLVQVWMGERFDIYHTIRWLTAHHGLRVSRSFGGNLLRWGIFHHWEEVKEYLMKAHKVDLEAYFKRHDENTKFAEKVRGTEDGTVKMSERLEAANLVGRELGRIIAIEAELDKKADVENKEDAFKDRLLTSIQELKEQKDGQS